MIPACEELRFPGVLWIDLKSSSPLLSLGLVGDSCRNIKENDVLHITQHFMLCCTEYILWVKDSDTCKAFVLEKLIFLALE